jgi:hypothetical protein
MEPLFTKQAQASGCASYQLSPQSSTGVIRHCERTSKKQQRSACFSCGLGCVLHSDTASSDLVLAMVTGCPPCAMQLEPVYLSVRSCSRGLDTRQLLGPLPRQCYLDSTQTVGRSNFVLSGRLELVSGLYTPLAERKQSHLCSCWPGH